MHATLKIPSPLRRFTENQSQIDFEAVTVNNVLDQLFDRCPEMRAQLMDEDGRLRNFVNIYMDKVDIRERGGLGAMLTDDCELRIVPAIAGGSYGSR